MAGDTVGSGESFHDDSPEVTPAEPAEPAEAQAPEYADPADDPESGQTGAAVDTRDSNLEDFEPDEADGEGPGDKRDETDIRDLDPDARARSGPGRPEDETTRSILDDVDDAAAQARREADRQRTLEPDRDDRAHVDLPADDVGRGGDRPTATTRDQDGRQEAADDPDAAQAADDADEARAESDQHDSREVFGDVERAHRDVMGDVQRAHQSVREMVEQANRDIDELIRTGQINDTPDEPVDVDETDIPDVEWDGPEGQGWDLPDDQDRQPTWEDWGSDDEGGSEESDGDRQGRWSDDVDWDKLPDTTDDDYAGIPYLTQAEVDARTQASAERSHELVSRDEPIRATDYSQEIQPLEDMPKGGAVHMGPTQMHVLRADDAEQFATDWNSHIERQEAAKYDHRFAQDARPISSQGMKDLAKATLAKEFEGRHYFQEAIPAVANGRCDPDQLRTILNELHPELRHQYGLYQPPAWRSLPYVRDSALQPHATRQVLQARQALEGYVKSLPDGHRYKGHEGTPIHTGAVRLRAEIDLYIRTRDPTAPRAIREARLHRLASALEAPKAAYDRREESRGTVHQQIPRELHELYHRARMADPVARIFRLYR